MKGGYTEDSDREFFVFAGDRMRYNGFIFQQGKFKVDFFHYKDDQALEQRSHGIFYLGKLDSDDPSLRRRVELDDFLRPLQPLVF